MLSRSSKMKKKHAQMIVTMALVLMALLTIGFSLAFINHSPKVQSVEAKVQKLYTDQDKIYLRTDLLGDEFAEVQNKIAELPFLKRQKYQTELIFAEEKYESLILLNQIFESKVNLQSDQTNDSLLNFDEELTFEKLQEIQNKIKFSQQDDFTDQVDNYLNTAIHTWNQIVDLEQEILEFQATTASSTGLVEYLNDFFTLEHNLSLIQGHPQSVHAQEALKAVAQEVGDTLQLDEDFDFDEELIKKIFDSEYLQTEISDKVDERKLIALTFDDGPNPEITPQVLEVLKKHDVIGTFFLLGYMIEEYPELVKQTVEAGHVVGNHSFSHPNFEELSDEKVLSEINDTQQAIKSATDGYESKYYRMPYGAGGKRVVNLLDPLTSVIWNVDSKDWLAENPTEILTRVTDTMQQQSIILFHDTHEHLVPVLDSLIPAMKEQGYEFVTPKEINYPYYHY